MTPASPPEAFMQAFAGIVTVSVGHCHDKVMEAVNRQANLLQHTTTIYLNPEIAMFAKELTDRLPGNLKVLSHYCYLICISLPICNEHSCHCSYVCVAQLE